MVFKSDKQRKFVMAKLNGKARSNVNPTIVKTKLSSFKAKKIKLVHSVKKKFKDKIRGSTNPNIVKGIFTIPREQFGREQLKLFIDRCQIELTTKRGIKLAILGTKFPIGLFSGGGDKNYQKVFKQLSSGLNKNKIEEGGTKERKEFVRRLNTELKRQKIDVVQNGGEFIIVNPKAILKKKTLRCPKAGEVKKLRRLEELEEMKAR